MWVGRGPGRPATSTWATRTRSRSSTTSPTPATLLDAPTHDEALYPHGVNVEFVVREGERHVAMRVHERGSGETRSCGTGACAVMVAAALADGATGPGDGQDLAYRVDVPGGTLTVTWTADDRVLLTGPAVVVARGPPALRVVCLRGDGAPSGTRPPPRIRRMDITGSSAIVTGAASGIGAAVARQLAAAGADGRGRRPPGRQGRGPRRGDRRRVRLRRRHRHRADQGGGRKAVGARPAADPGELRRHRLGAAHDRPGRRVRLRPRPRRVLQGDRDQPDRHLRRDPARRHRDEQARARPRPASAARS